MNKSILKKYAFTKSGGKIDLVMYLNELIYICRVVHSIRHGLRKPNHYFFRGFLHFIKCILIKAAKGKLLWSLQGGSKKFYISKLFLFNETACITLNFCL